MNALKIKSTQPFILFGKFVLLFCLGAMLAFGLNISPLAAQQASITQAQIMEIVSGDQVYIQNKQAKEKDIAKQQQQVSTGKARTELEFNNKAIARLSSDSALTVGGCGAKLTKGSVLINGAVNGCTSTISAGVRGTTYLLAIDEEGNEKIQVLEGEVEVVSRFNTSDDPDKNDDPNAPDDASEPDDPNKTDDPEQGVIREVVSGGQVFSISPKSREFVLRSLTVDEFRAIIEGALFKGYSRELASLDKIQQVLLDRFPDVELPDVDLPTQPQAPRKLMRLRGR